MALLDMLFPQNKPGMAPANPQPQTQQGGGILAALLGADNPAAQWASQNRNYLGTIGTGIANGLRFGDLGAARTLDTLTAQEAQQKNATQEWLKKNKPDLAAMVDAGLPVGQAWGVALNDMAPKAEIDPTTTAAGRQQLAQNLGLQGNDLVQYVLTGKFSDGTTLQQNLAAAGLQPGTQEYKDAVLKNLGGTTVNVNTGEGQDGALNKALSTKEGESWATLKDAGATAGALSNDLSVLDQLINVAPQGPLVGPLAETFKGFNSAGDVFQSVVKRVAPSLRAPGSGATSDIEYEGFLQSLPSLKNTKEANAAINALMKAKAALNIKRADIVTQYQAGNLTAAQARAQLQQLNSQSIITPEIRKALSNVGSSSQAPATPKIGDVVDGYTYIGGDPSLVSSWKEP